MRKISKLVIYTFILLLSFLPIFTSFIDGNNVSVVEAASIKLSSTKTTLLKNKTKTIKLTGNKNKVTWKTSKKSVVKIVSKTKNAVKIKAVRVGRAAISAQVGKKKYKCVVTVVDPKLDKTKVTMHMGEQLVVNVMGGTGKYTWKSSDPSVATVSKNGTVSAKKNGATVLTAVRNGKKMTCKVIVKLRSKKVWVVTKKGWTEYRPVYEETYYFECTTCGALFNMETEAEENREHRINHLMNGEASGWRDKVIRKLLYVEEIVHPEEGYWKTVYY